MFERKTNSHIFYYLSRGSLLAIFGLWVYAQTFHFGFVFDDYIFIVNNPYIKNFSHTGLMWHNFPLTRLIGIYTFVFNYYLNQLNPVGYHIVNFIIHFLASLCVWALASSLFQITQPFAGPSSKDLSFFVALLFMVHPCQTQAVTYITQRFESLATLFYLATVCFYLRARLANQQKLRVLLFSMAAVSGGLGILTKEVMATVPAVILALEWIILQKNKKQLLPIIAAAAVFVYIIMAKLVHENLGIFTHTLHSESHDGDILTPLRYLMTQLRVFLTFLRLLIFPIHQALDYDYPVSLSMWNPPLTLLGLIMIALIVVCIVRLRVRLPLVSFGLAWILITFSINLVPRTNVIFEHKLYLISFGFFLAFVGLSNQLVKNYFTLIKLFGALAIILAFLSFERNKLWAHELSLWQENVEIFPNKSRVNANLGRAYWQAGDDQKAIYYLSRAITLYPDNITYENRGIIYGNHGEMDKALADLNKSIQMEPFYALTYVKRAWVLQNQHLYTAALADLNQAIHLDPYSSDAYFDRGLLWLAEGHKSEAFNDFQQVLRIDPFNRQAENEIKQIKPLL